MEPVPARDHVLGFARAEGFELVRFAPATAVPAVRAAAQASLAAGHLEGMEWITASWLDRATDPGAFLPGARAVILVALPCHPPLLSPPTQEDGGFAGDAAPARGRIARYAWGRDYHRVFETKLRRIARRIRDELGAAARATVDYGPLLERPLAAAAGLGWQGRSTMLLVPGLGPWVLLGAIATTLGLPASEPLRKSCGSCRRCVVACPTGALGSDGQLLDARLCISYHTIENRGPIPRDLRPLFGDWVFGCDDCLDSCPVGAATHDTHPDFAAASFDDARPALAPLLALDAAAFETRFRGRAVMRAHRDGFLRNVCVALGNTGGASDLPALLSALSDSSALVRGHAAWAAAQVAARLGDCSLAAAAMAALAVRLACEDDPAVHEELELALAASRE